MCFLMMNSDSNGFYLFQKTQGSDNALKDMLQFLRSETPGKSLHFAYVEGETSLLPYLTLWENLHVAVGGSSWKDFLMQLEVDWQPLVNLIKDPNQVAAVATPWERLTISLIKATLIQSQNILIDMNEVIYSPLNLLNFKKMLVTISQQKNIYIATANTSHWLDYSQGLIKREGYEFVVESLISKKSKHPRSA